MKRPATTVAVPPPPRQGSRLPPPPPPSDVPDNLTKPSDEKLQDLNFKVASDFHRTFKITALMWNMTMKELLEASFRLWVEQHGDKPRKD